MMWNIVYLATSILPLLHLFQGGLSPNSTKDVVFDLVMVGVKEISSLQRLPETISHFGDLDIIIFEFIYVTDDGICDLHLFPLLIILQTISHHLQLLLLLDGSAIFTDEACCTLLTRLTSSWNRDSKELSLLKVHDVGRVTAEEVDLDTAGETFIVWELGHFPCVGSGYNFYILKLDLGVVTN